MRPIILDGINNKTMEQLTEILKKNMVDTLCSRFKFHSGFCQAHFR